MSTLARLSPRARKLAILTGTTAAIISSVSLMPQAYRVSSTRNVSGLALETYALIVCSSVFWIVYSYVLGAPHVIASSTFNLVTSGTIVATIVSIRFFGGEGVDTKE
mmetsp:Transcript_18511/g.32843  ORF Transcript_18511/g.32843 Transcript_18511/m.32843 type:complete len:107 (-) Transcript_18511:115-435(-)